MSRELSEKRRKAGKLGGAARARALSAERRTEISQKAARTRWTRHLEELAAQIQEERTTN